MKSQYLENRKGFTLIELMIVLVILSVITPAVYRLYHEGFRSGHDNFSRTSGTIRDTGILFNYIAADLNSSTGLIASFDRFNTDQTTLIIKGIDLKKRAFYLSETGDLTNTLSIQEDECIIIYYINDSDEVIREEYIGESVSQKIDQIQNGAKKSDNIRYITGNNDEGIFISHDFNQTALLGDIETLQFTYNSSNFEKVRRLNIKLTRKTGYNEVWPVGSLCRVYHLSQ